MPSNFWFDFDALSDHDASDASDHTLRSQDVDACGDCQSPHHDKDAETQKHVALHETEDQSSQTNCSMESALIETDTSEHGDRNDGRTGESEASDSVDNPIVLANNKEIDPHSMSFAQRRAIFEPRGVLEAEFADADRVQLVQDFDIDAVIKNGAKGVIEEIACEGDAMVKLDGYQRQEASGCAGGTSVQAKVAHVGGELGPNKIDSLDGSGVSECFKLDGHSREEIDVGDAEPVRIEKQLSTMQFFDWNLLPELVLSQRERALIDVDDVTTAQATSWNSARDGLDVWLCCDGDGHPRGRCQNCKDCESYVLADHSYICWEAGKGPMDHSSKCEKCNCAVFDHEKSPSWLTLVQASLKRLRDTGTNTKRERPTHSQLPVAALHWDPTDVALYVLTEGVFDPRRDSRGKRLEGAHWCKEEEQRSKAERRPLVSIITPTSSSRQEFHPLLYECFRTQQYEPKELIVVETGSTPSQFLQQCARRDPRIVYRFWPVDDARMQDLSETVMEEPAWPTSDNKDWGKGGNGKGGANVGAAKYFWPNDPKRHKMSDYAKPRPYSARLKDKLRGKVRGGRRQEGWTLGMKRNIACHLARGDVIAHFDDDDLYAPIYLTQMVPKLLETATYRPENGRIPAAAVTLEAWHVVDLSDQTFGFFAPRKEELLVWDMRESFAYGFGFSYLYSKAAWDMQAFADVEWSEDGNFTAALMQKRRPVRLVNPRFLGNGIEAVAAHSHHRETTSGGEFTEVTYVEYGTYRSVTKALRMGNKVGTPRELLGLLPLVRSIVSSKNISKHDLHPVRQVITLNPARGEVGLEQKKDFMRRYGAGLGHGKIQPRVAPQQWSNPAHWGKGNWQWPWGKGGGKGKTPGPPWWSQGKRPPIPQRPSTQLRM